MARGRREQSITLPKFESRSVAKGGEFEGRKTSVFFVKFIACAAYCVHLKLSYCLCVPKSKSALTILFFRNDAFCHLRSLLPRFHQLLQCRMHNRNLVERQMLLLLLHPLNRNLFKQSLSFW